METDNTSPHNPAPRHPQPGMTPRSAAPMGRRPMVDGIAPRRPAGAPVHGTPAHPHRPAHHPGTHHIAVSGGSPTQTPAPTHHAPVHHAPAQHPPRPSQSFAARPAGTDFAPRPQTATVPRAHAPVPEMREFTPPPDDLQPAAEAKVPKEKSQTGRSGLVGFVAFVLLTGLLVSPLLPGKILHDFPLTSESFSTGDQSLDCVGTQGQINSNTVYRSKAGAPIAYTYSTVTTDSAVCNGKSQSAVTGHDSQFSPLGLLVDIVVALAVAIAIAKVWRFVYTRRQNANRPATRPQESRRN